MNTKIIAAFLSVSALGAVATNSAAQADANHQMMPSMQHEMSGMRHEGQARTATNPPVPDLLESARRQPAMELGQFEQLALANSPTLRQLASVVKQSAGLAKQAGLLPNPSIGYQGEQIRGGSYGGGEQGAFVQQTFVLGGKLGLRRNVYEQQQREDVVTAEEQRYRVLGDIRQQFYMTLAAQQLVTVREQLIRLAKDAAETAHQLANVGQADAPDVLQSEVEAEQAMLDYTIAQRSFLQQFAALAALAGKSDLAPALLKGNLENIPSVDTATVVDQIVRNSPSVKRAQQGLAVSDAQVKSAKRESIPDLQIHAGLQDNLEPLGAGNRPVGVQGFVTAGITLPLFNRNQGNVTAAEAQSERSRAEIDRVRLSLQQAAAPVVQDYLANQEQASRYRIEIIPRAKKAYQLYSEKYQQMAAAYPQVLVSQRTLFELQISYIQVLQQLWRDATALDNFLLSDGLTMPSGVAPANPTINLPNSGGAGAP